MTHHAIIIGHGKMAHVAEFLLPMWREVFDGLQSVSPRNDPLDLYGVWSFKIGQSSHSGTDTADRFMAAALLAALSEADLVSLLEYDSFAFPEYRKLCTPEHGVFYCGYLFDNNDPAFFAPKYTHWPVTATPLSWKTLALNAANVIQRGMSDRWLAAGVMASDMRLEPVAAPVHYSANHIDAEKIDAACLAVQMGAPCLHGIKDKATFDRLVAAYNKRAR